MRQVDLSPSPSPSPVPSTLPPPSVGTVLNMDFHRYGYLVVNTCTVRERAVGQTGQMCAKACSELRLYSLNECDSGEDRLGHAEFNEPLLPFSLIPSPGHQGRSLICHVETCHLTCVWLLRLIAAFFIFSGSCGPQHYIHPGSPRSANGPVDCVPVCAPHLQYRTVVRRAVHSRRAQ
jgi:hypothetical protein